MRSSESIAQLSNGGQGPTLKKVFFHAAVLFLCSVGPAITAQPRGDTKILLPLLLEEPIRGAFGSQWITRASILNTGPSPITIDGYIIEECSILCDQFRPTPPGITFYPKFFLNTNEVEGYFLSTTRDDLPFVRVDLHAQDVSRQSLAWGTEIPTVPETEAFTGKLVLGDIPVNSNFRSLLRVYDFDPAPNSPSKAIAYRIYGVRPLLVHPMDPADSTLNSPTSPDPLLASGELHFVIAQTGLRSLRPGYTRLDLSSIPIQSSERIRIELTPVTPGLRYWAFVAVTNNETQHITTVTP